MRSLTDLVAELTAVVGAAHVLVEPAAQQRFLRDFSWYSPVLSEAFMDNAPIDAVVQPATLDELERVVAGEPTQVIPVLSPPAGSAE